MYTAESVMYEDGFHNKIPGWALVTGGARGLGEAMVIQLAREGYDVVINYVSSKSTPLAEAVAARVRTEFGVRAMTYQCDVSSYDNCRAMFDAAVAEFGDQLAVLINNAGIQNGKPFHEQPVEEYSRLINIELFGSMHCTNIALPYMMKQQNGCIIHIASICCQVGYKNQSDYSAAKGGLVGFSKSIATTYAEYGIRSNCIAPGLIMTPMVKALPQERRDIFAKTVPLKRLGIPEDISSTMSFLVNNTYITGTTISVNGGSYMPAGA